MRLKNRFRGTSSPIVVIHALTLRSTQCEPTAGVKYIRSRLEGTYLWNQRYRYGNFPVGETYQTRNTVLKIRSLVLFWGFPNQLSSDSWAVGFEEAYSDSLPLRRELTVDDGLGRREELREEVCK